MAENWSHLAKVADDLCFYRGCQVDSVNHPTAMYQMNCGNRFGGDPGLGAWVNYGLGTENTDLPGFVTICPTLAHGGVNNWGSAFLPAWCQGTPLGNASVPAPQAVVKHIRNAGTSPAMQRMQLDLVSELNHNHLQESAASSMLEARINSFELAFRMQTAMPELQDISNESE
eukprot:gene1278-1596_t